MTQPTQITTHAADAIQRLLERHKGRENITAIAQFFGEKIQELEDLTYDYLETRWVTDATGFQLDLIGEIVGQNRLGFDDDFYRVLLLVRIAINNSQGAPISLISIFNLITGSTNTHYINDGNGVLRIIGNGTNPLTTGAQLYEQLQRVVLAGVRIEHIGLSPEAPAVPFVYAGGNGTGTGYYNPGASVNGGYAELLENT